MRTLDDQPCGNQAVSIKYAVIEPDPFVAAAKYASLASRMLLSALRTAASPARPCEESRDRSKIVLDHLRVDRIAGPRIIIGRRRRDREVTPPSAPTSAHEPGMPPAHHTYPTNVASTMSAAAASIRAARPADKTLQARIATS
jgi:hypothetical protein